ncbi:MAG: glucose 1-dehydrogenase [Clostridiaceae bacterium]|nr:glucose 1-dehydrogenase [Clostridiaceae bacterium]
MFDFKGRVVLITGASSGLGVQMAKGFAELGADLVITARRFERLEAFAKELNEEYGVKALPVACDVTSTEQVDAAVEKAIAEFGKIDVLINNAGSSKGGPVHELSDENWNFTMDTDLTSVFKMTRAASKHMIEAGYGRIINIASMYGLLGTNQQETAYHASKAGVVNFSRAAGAELAPHGITVNTICPGYFLTELTEETFSGEEFKAYMGMTVPAGRPGEPGELNAAAIFLASEEASYVNGVALPVDGGWSSAK